MPALSGSDKAYRQARSGIARAGATRCGYFVPNVVTTISGTDRSTLIEEGTRITKALNDEPDTASFTVKPGAGFVPVPFQPVIIGLGTAVNREFAGSIARVSHRRLEGLMDIPALEVQCIDWTRLFNRRRVNRIYRGSIGAATLSAIVLNVIALDTSGFTSVAVQSSATVPDLFIIEDETPGQILTRLVALNGGGGWYIDADRDVHWFGPSGETGGHAPTAPLSITNTRSTLIAFTHAKEGRELRNRVIVKGRSTRTLATVPNDYALVQTWGIPIELSWMFNQTNGVVNLGGQVFSYSTAITFGAANDFANVSVAATAGATSVDVTDATSFRAALDIFSHMWVADEADNVFVCGVHATLNRLISIPASGYGSLLVDLLVGVKLRIVGILAGTVPADGTLGFDEIPKGETVRVRVVVNNTAEQTALAAIEGGDGIHEFIIDAPTADYLEAAEIGQADLDQFADEAGLSDAQWVTRDMNADIGAQQVISITGSDAFSDTLTITRVELTFPVANEPPIRRCVGSRVKYQEFTDVIVRKSPYGD